jgi:hypothetical protein
VLIERGGAPYVFSDIDGPPGWDPATTTVEAALLPEGVDATDADWKLAAWEGKSARYQIDTASVADGRYMLKFRLTRGAEHVVLPSGRVTVGAATP